MGRVDAEAITQVGEEGDAELATGLHQAEHDVACLATIGAHRATRDPALGDAGAQVVFGGIGVERDLRSLHNLQQFVLSPVQASQQLTRFFVARALPKDLVEALSEVRPVHSRRLLFSELQIAVEEPFAGLLRCFRHFAAAARHGPNTGHDLSLIHI